jgi:outer membrane protein OmpA-like peptidoglycan-associated protein
VFTPLVLKRGNKPEGESPFWISFSDLMSALMVLFLLVMAVTLISVTKDVTTTEQRKIQREKDIKELMSTIREVSREFPEIKVNESTYRIDLGEIVRFERGRSDIQSSGGAFLRRYVPVLLKAQGTDLGQQWIRRIVVEGFTDQDGTYLYNLGLSLDRSRKVVCVLFAPTTQNESPLTDAEKKKVRDLFLVGGYSFNSMRASKEESRRVELRVDFWQLDETKESAPDLSDKEFGQC